MENHTGSFVTGPLAAVLWVSRFVGVAPVRFRKQGNGWNISLSTGCSLYGYFIITIDILVSVWGIIEVLKLKNMTSVVWCQCGIALTITVAIMVCDAPRRIRCMITCMNHCYKINSQLNIRHKLIPWTKKIIAVFTFWALIIIISFVQALPYFIEGEVIIISSMHLSWTVQLVLMQFALLVLQVRSCFESVNDSLKNLLQHDSPTIKCCRESVRNIASGYTLACKLVRDVNRCHGPMLIFLLSSIFFQFTITAYAFVYDFCTNNLRIRTASQLFWCLYHTFNLVMFIEPCHLTTMEKDNTRELVSQLIQRTRSVHDPVAAAELEQFSRHIDLNNVSFAPLDIITIDRGLLITVISSVTTYLVVLIDIK